MTKLILRRLLETIPVLLLLATLAFFMMRSAPGSAFDREKEVPDHVRAAYEAQYGLNDPLIVQYGRFLGVWPRPNGQYLGLLQGDLGVSTTYTGWTVAELMGAKIPVSLELGLYALIIAVLIGVTMGVLAAWRPHSWTDHLPMSLAMLGICLPTFVIGPLLILAFSLELPWFNVSGWEFPGDRVLPSLTLGLFYAPYLARLTRGSMLEVRNADFMRTALAKGVSGWRVYAVHGLRNGILPVISFLGPAAAGLISGSFVVETIFRIPGLGRFFVEAAINRDAMLVIGCALFYAALLVLLNLAAEILQATLNPKLRFA
ncbi:ABC transporter permease [Cerasicoccus arenae]|uniref:Peptide ABC transporter permease n=1 Tax=Cerasicoccus arenae TaxID=424488 RepID=A0A8J3DE68_9BACT|nr:ABC transporter permease [Cerasicoccus arenae]MBK1858862.1 ABC transporter permease [Cerasicoccus arenae]GHB96117.1 peptide ABC transporter permease [Cerasicoccus arenae]